MIWVAISALCVAVLMLGWLVRECRLENKRLREELVCEAERRATWWSEMVKSHTDLSVRQTEATELVEQLRVALTSLDDEYKDTTHAHGLWQAGIEERLSDLNLRIARNTAALDALPNAADIIAAVTGPFVELARPRPYQFQPADLTPDQQANEDAWDTYDPTDDEFPIRDPGDFTPPAAFGGLPGL